MDELKPLRVHVSSHARDQMILRLKCDLSKINKIATKAFYQGLPPGDRWRQKVRLLDPDKELRVYMGYAFIFAPGPILVTMFGSNRNKYDWEIV